MESMHVISVFFSVIRPYQRTQNSPYRSPPYYSRKQHIPTLHFKLPLENLHQYLLTVHTSSCWFAYTALITFVERHPLANLQVLCLGKVTLRKSLSTMRIGFINYSSWGPGKKWNVFSRSFQLQKANSVTSAKNRAQVSHSV